jgi:hypothetical protein
VATGEGVSLNQFKPIQRASEPVSKKNAVEFNMLKMGKFEAGAERGERKVSQIREIEGGHDSGQCGAEGLIVATPPEQYSQDKRSEIETAVSDLEVFSEPGMDPRLEPDRGVHSEEDRIDLSQQRIQVSGVDRMDQVVQLSESQGNAQDVIPIARMNPGKGGFAFGHLNQNEDDSGPNQVNQRIGPCVSDPLVEDYHDQGYAGKVTEGDRIINADD